MSHAIAPPTLTTSVPGVTAGNQPSGSVRRVRHANRDTGADRGGTTRHVDLTDVVEADGVDDEPTRALGCVAVRAPVAPCDHASLGCAGQQLPDIRSRSRTLEPRWTRCRRSSPAGQEARGHRANPTGPRHPVGRAPGSNRAIRPSSPSGSVPTPCGRPPSATSRPAPPLPTRAPTTRAAGSARRCSPSSRGFIASWLGSATRTSGPSCDGRRGTLMS